MCGAVCGVQYVEVDQYPLPVPEDLTSSLTGGKAFMKLDLGGSWWPGESKPVGNANGRIHPLAYVCM